MNLDELKPLWETYKERADDQFHWSEAALTDLIQQKNTYSYPWLLNLCVSVLLVGITGC
jgi:hypothetical protein